MKFEILFANILFAASTAFAVPMDLDSFPEITNVSDDADTTAHPPTPDSPPSTPPVVIPVVGTIDELPNIGVLERSPVFNQEEITRLNDKILSVPLVVGQEEQLYLVVHEAKTFQYHNEQAGKRQRLENHGVLFTFSLSMIDTIRVEQQFWDDVLYALSDDQPGVSTVIDEANSPNTLRQPLKSCFTAAWRPGGVVKLKLVYPL